MNVNKKGYKCIEFIPKIGKSSNPSVKKTSC